MLRRSTVISIAVFFIILAAIIVIPQHRPLHADFTFPLGDSLKSLDPAQIVWNEEILIANGLWEGLTSFDPKTTTPVPGVAQLPCRISPDQCTYTFQLRSDACWSNGDPVTADDFVYAWRRAIEPGTAGDYSCFITDNIVGAKDYYTWRNRAVKILSLLRQLQNHQPVDSQNYQWLNEQLPDIPQSEPDWADLARQFRDHHLAQMNEKFSRVGICALSPSQLQVTLNRPVPYFLDLTSFATFLPLHKQSLEIMRLKDDPAATELTLRLYDPQWVKPQPLSNGYPGLITNGPFTLTQWQFKRYMLLKKNPYYWDRQHVPSNRIIARIMPEPGAAFLAYEKGELDWLRDLTRLDFAPTLIELTKQHKRDDIHYSPAFGLYYYLFNCKPTFDDGRKNPFHDPKVRMAFNLAVDKVALVNQVIKNGNRPARNFIPPGSIPGYHCPAGLDFDPEKARALLAEAGFANGDHMPTIEILYNTGFYHGPVAEALAQMWKNNLNIHVMLVGKEIKSYEDDRRNQRFMLCRSGWYGDYLDPTTFLDLMTTENGNNKAAFSNPQYDGLIQSAARCADPSRRLTILAQAEQHLMNDYLPILPLYYYVNLNAWRPQVKGLYPNSRDQHPLKYVFVEK